MFSKFIQFFKSLFSSPPTSGSELEKQVRNLIAESKVLEAMHILIDAGHSQVALLKNQWEDAQLQFNDRLIDIQSFQLTRNRISYALLAMISPGEELDATAPPITITNTVESLPSNLTADQVQQIRSLLSNNQWRDALGLVKDWSMDGHLLHQRFQQITTDNLMGLVSPQDYSITRMRIIQALLDFVFPEMSEMPPKLTDQQTQQLRSLLDLEQWPEMFNLACHWSHAFLLPHIRYQLIKEDFKDGLIEKTDYKDQLHKLSLAIRQLLGA